jgi:hypothetical protein
MLPLWHRAHSEGLNDRAKGVRSCSSSLLPLSARSSTLIIILCLCAFRWGRDVPFPVKSQVTVSSAQSSNFFPPVFPYQDLATHKVVFTYTQTIDLVLLPVKVCRGRLWTSYINRRHLTRSVELKRTVVFPHLCTIDLGGRGGRWSTGVRERERDTARECYGRYHGPWFFLWCTKVFRAAYGLNE